MGDGLPKMALTSPWFLESKEWEEVQVGQMEGQRAVGESGLVRQLPQDLVGSPPVPPA